MGTMREKRAEVAGKAKKAVSVLKGEGGIFKKLSEEHGEVASLLKQVSSSDDVEVRRRLYPKIKAEIISHARAEEKEFYSVLERFSEMTTLISHSRSEHQDLDAILEELDLLAIDSNEWVETFEQMREMVEDHVKVEEGEIFKRAKVLLDSDRVAEAERLFTEEKERQLAIVGKHPTQRPAPPPPAQ